MAYNATRPSYLVRCDHCGHNARRTNLERHQASANCHVSAATQRFRKRGWTVVTRTYRRALNATGVHYEEDWGTYTMGGGSQPVEMTGIKQLYVPETVAKILGLGYSAKGPDLSRTPSGPSMYTVEHVLFPMKLRKRMLEYWQEADAAFRLGGHEAFMEIFERVSKPRGERHANDATGDLG